MIHKLYLPIPYLEDYYQTADIFIFTYYKIIINLKKYMFIKPFVAMETSVLYQFANYKYIVANICATVKYFCSRR